MSLSLNRFEGIIRPILQPISWRAGTSATKELALSKQPQIEVKIGPLHPAIAAELGRWREWETRSSILFELEEGLHLGITDSIIPARTALKKVIPPLPIKSPDFALQEQAIGYLSVYCELGMVQLTRIAEEYVKLRKSQGTVSDKEVVDMAVRNVLHSQNP